MKEHQNRFLCFNNWDLEILLNDWLTIGFCLSSIFFNFFCSKLGYIPGSPFILGLWGNSLAIMKIMLNFSKAEENGTQILLKN
jgi:hypothetical protein